MKPTTILLALTSAASAVANPHHGQGYWKPPGHGDCMYKWLFLAGIILINNSPRVSNAP